ncbi:MAG: hypothetical protein AB8G96_13325 [Phycisphaerales bacterium]
MRLKHLTSAGAVAALALSLPASATRVFVEPDATGANDGTSWSDALVSLQDALRSTLLEIANPREQHEVWVKGSVYRTDDGANLVLGDELVSFVMRPETLVYGGIAGGESELKDRDIDQFETVLTGDLGTGNAVHVVSGHVDQNTDLNIRDGLHGVTVTGGFANVDVSEPIRNGRGGCFFANENTNKLTLAASTFKENDAVTGAGASVDVIPSPFNINGITEPEDANETIISGNIFTANRATITALPPAAAETGGGGLALVGGTVKATVMNNIFHDNSVADPVEGDQFPAGCGGVALFESIPLLLNTRSSTTPPADQILVARVCTSGRKSSIPDRRFRCSRRTSSSGATLEVAPAVDRSRPRSTSARTPKSRR